MSDRQDRELLADVVEAARRASLYISGVSYEQCLEDIKTQDAVARTLEIVGEATKRLSRDLRENLPRFHGGA